MSRSNQQLVRLIQELIRQVQSGKLSLRWILGLVVLGVGYFLLQPVVERSLGIDLPGFGDLATNRQIGGNPPGAAKKETAPPEASSGTPTKPNTPAERNRDGGGYQEIINSNSGKVYRSPAGLRYTRGSQHGHRLKHLMAHTRDQPDRPGQHGVFDSSDVAEVIAIVDEAYLQAQTGRDTRSQREQERTVYDVNLRRRIGYIGGTSGNRRNHPVAKHLRLVLEGDRFITGFPVRP